MYFVTGSPVAVVSSVSSMLIVPGDPWENVSFGVFRPGALTSDHWFDLAMVSSAGLNRHSMFSPRSGSMNAFTGAAAVAAPPPAAGDAAGACRCRRSAGVRGARLRRHRRHHRRRRHPRAPPGAARFLHRAVGRRLRDRRGGPRRRLFELADVRHLEQPLEPSAAALELRQQALLDRLDHRVDLPALVERRHRLARRRADRRSGRADASLGPVAEGAGLALPPTRPRPARTPRRRRAPPRRGARQSSTAPSAAACPRSDRAPPPTARRPPPCRRRSTSTPLRRRERPRGRRRRPGSDEIGGRSRSPRPAPTAPCAPRSAPPHRAGRPCRPRRRCRAPAARRRRAAPRRTSAAGGPGRRRG